jgi:hypothetical protein
MRSYVNAHLRNIYYEPFQPQDPETAHKARADHLTDELTLFLRHVGQPPWDFWRD